MQKTVVRYGIYGALTICVLFLCAWFIGGNLDFTIQEIIGYASMVVSLSFVYFGIRHFRERENDGYLTFKKGLIIGVLISLLTALAFGILDIIYIKFINPDFMTEYYDTSLKQMKETLSAEEFQLKRTEMESQKELFTSPFMNFLIMFMTVFVIGFIISMLSALVLQNKK